MSILAVELLKAEVKGNKIRFQALAIIIRPLHVPRRDVGLEVDVEKLRAQAYASMPA